MICQHCKHVFTLEEAHAQDYIKTMIRLRKQPSVTIFVGCPRCMVSVTVTHNYVRINQQIAAIRTRTAAQDETARLEEAIGMTIKEALMETNRPTSEIVARYRNGMTYRMSLSEPITLPPDEPIESARVAAEPDSAE